MNDAYILFVVAGGATALLSLAVLWRKFSGTPEPRSISPQPLVVKEAPKYAEQKDLDALRIELTAKLEAHERRNESDMAIIRADLSQLRRGSEYVQRRMNGMTRTLYAIAGKMGVIPSGGEPEGGE